MHGKRGEQDVVSLSTPWVLLLSSPMDTVIEGAMAATMASLGGLGIVHSNLFVAYQAFVVHSIKSHRVPILSAPTFHAPFDHIHSLNDFDFFLTKLFRSYGRGV